jgi:hypothetical protein
MNRFNIQFDYNNTAHDATVIKITSSNNLPIQYIIFDVNPEIDNGPPVFVYCPENILPELLRTMSLMKC